ncbi:eukaryotic translation initiation factor 4E1-like [Pieris rapae]|uniref:eukaryotic translation initiation factor 4E1-like n=1 Tax=Pieris rapae TaxID=64459 RepID=UPI001E27A4E7|nr:eukaryotic translation initiation factor 4E1-like [Pieris rapae]
MASNSEDLQAVKMNTTLLTNDYYHPLEYHWNLWVFTNDKENWEENLVCAADFESVEGFWSIINHIKMPSEMKLGQDYLIFKKGIQPKWEHPANMNGGRWIINVEKNLSRLNEVWVHVLLLMIGENLPHGDIICGAVVNIRSKCKIGLWLSDGSNQKKVKEVGEVLKDNIKSHHIGKINFHLHMKNFNIHTI